MYANIEVDASNHPVLWPQLIREDRLEGLILVGAFIEGAIDQLKRQINMPIVLVDSYAPHLPYDSMETYICIRPRRARCLVCATEPTTTQVLEWYDQRSPHTKAYDRYLLKQLVNSTIEEVSLSENVGYDAIVGALNRQIDTKVDWEQVDDLSTVGIDEVAMSKGRKNYAAIITTRQQD
jgi:hypothetical protein